ncbi:MAG TPA: toxin TcdB middle/N-terminal domain-containing protein, partial [Pyrinomonadaceae bacterium]
FNGDGKSDLLYLAQSGGLQVRFGTGTALSGPVTVGGGLTGWAVLDWDGDGFDDVLTEVSGVWQVRRSTGESFAAAVSTGISTAGAGVVTIADANGDGLYDLIHLVGTDVRYRAHAGVYPDLLLTATDGFGVSTTFSYAALPNYGSYSKQSGAVYPTQDYVGPMYVVSNLAQSNGIGGTFNLQSLYYQGARLNLQGRGFLGFEYRSWIDSRDGTAQRRSFRQDFPYIGAVTNARRTQEPSGTAITEVQTLYSTVSYGSGFETRSYPFASRITQYDREAGGTFNGALMRTADTTVLVDSVSGTPYDVTTTVTEPASGANGVQPGASYVRRIYTPLTELVGTPSTWCQGLPGQTQVTTSHNQFGGGSITRTTDIQWDTFACRPTQVDEEIDNASLTLTRLIGYDAFGNLNSETVSGSGVPVRTTSSSWGSTGQFPISVTQSVTSTFSQTTNKTWNYAFGTQASETDPNGIPVNWQYDDFGRRTREDRPDQTYTTWQYLNGTCDPRAKMIVLARQFSSTNVVVADNYAYLDQQERVVDEYRTSFSGGGYDTVMRTFDALGRTATIGAPFLSGGCTPSAAPAYVATFQYDLLSRPAQVSRPTSDSNPTLVTTAAFYEGLTTRVVDPLSKQSTQVVNAAGALARSIDHDGYYQNFDYDGFGNIVRVTDSLSNTLQSNTFNIRGMLTKQVHMDADVLGFTYVPNALGEVTSQTTAKNQTTTFTYDLLGRMTSRSEPEGTSTFTFGTSSTNKNIGRLIGMSGPGGYSENFAYDSIGRLSQRSITSDMPTAYDFSFTYNNQGMLDTLTYPVSTSSYQLKLQYEYQSGRLLRVKDFNAPTTVFWQANAA